MTVYTTLCFLAAAAMLIAFINSKIGQMQTTIAITAGALILSLIIVISGHNNWFHLKEFAATTLNEVHFDDFLLKGVLGFFAVCGRFGRQIASS